MLVSLKKVLRNARRMQYAVGAFNVDNLEGVLSVLEAADMVRAPVILATSESSIRYAGFAFLQNIIRTASEEYPHIPIVLHLDHGKDMSLIRSCIEHGWTSVMFDGSDLSYEENIKRTKQVVELASTHSVSVEAELGALGSMEDANNLEGKSTLTDPDEAADFVRKTRIDALAVSIGTAHGPHKFEGAARLDFKRLIHIAERVSLPLVLHGASGVPKKIISLAHKGCEKMEDCTRLAQAQGIPDRMIKLAISLGIAKINIGTDMRLAFTAGMRAALLSHPSEYDERQLLKEARTLMREVVTQKLKLFGSARYFFSHTSQT